MGILAHPKTVVFGIAWMLVACSSPASSQKKTMETTALVTDPAQPVEPVEHPTSVEGLSPYEPSDNPNTLLPEEEHAMFEDLLPERVGEDSYTYVIDQIHRVDGSYFAIVERSIAPLELEEVDEPALEEPVGAEEGEEPAEDEEGSPFDYLPCETEADLADLVVYQIVDIEGARSIKDELVVANQECAPAVHAVGVSDLDGDGRLELALDYSWTHNDYGAVETYHMMVVDVTTLDIQLNLEVGFDNSFEEYEWDSEEMTRMFFVPRSDGFSDIIRQKASVVGTCEVDDSDWPRPLEQQPQPITVLEEPSSALEILEEICDETFAEHADRGELELIVDDLEDLCDRFQLCDVEHSLAVWIYDVAQDEWVTP